jgi:hypothetical protein
MRKHSGLLLLTLIFSLAFAEKGNNIPFDAQSALAYLKDLASDSMLGRKSGQPGGVLAEDYIASRLKEWGIEPGGVNGTYFQPFTFPQFNIGPGARLEIITDRKRKDFDYEDCWRVWTYSGSGRFTAEIVFVGYGIHAPEKGYDDFADVNIQGKMALLITETPLNLGRILGDDVDIKKRILSIQKHGAKGVFICDCPVPGKRTIQGSLDAEVYKPDFVIIRIEASVARYVFRDLPTDLSYLIQEMDSTSRPQSYATGVMAALEVDAVYDENRPTRNVLGRISGSDKKLKGEYIIVAAHMDHLGINPQGEVMNGANDNASGTSVAMEVARVLKKSRSKLKRSVVFFLWAAEEQGYRGLTYYCQHPVYPLEKTVAYITMDMVGHGNGKVTVSGKDYRPDLWEFLAQHVPENIFKYVQPSTRFSHRLPDWEPLLPTGVARLGIQTSGQHLKLHTSRDDVDLIKPELLERTGNFIRAAVEALADEQSNLIPAFRREDYYLKVVRLIDYQPLTLGQVAEHPEETLDSPANVRLAVVEEEEGLAGDALRVDTTKSALDCLAGIKKSGRISIYASIGRLQDDMIQRRTDIIPGIGSIRTLTNDPDWAKALAEVGVRFVWLSDPSPLFAGDAVTQDGKRIWSALEDNGIIIMVSALTPGCQRMLLENARKPFVLIEQDLPQAEILELIQKKKAVLALVLNEKGAAEYYQKLDQARRVLGSKRLMIMNGLPIQEKKSIDLFRQLTREILQAGYEWKDIQDLFSGTFLSLFE